MSNWRNIDETYVYDGTLEGFFTVIYIVFDTKVLPENIVEESKLQFSMLNTNTFVNTDLDKSYNIFKRIPKELGYYSLYNVCNTFASNLENKEMYLLKYILKGFMVGRKIDTMLNLDYVLTVTKCSKRVYYEAHRFMGFCRFEQVHDNTFYSAIEPDNNILEIISRHFKARLSTQNWIIHDKKRSIAAIYSCNTECFEIVKLDGKLSPLKSEIEQDYIKLWKAFYKSITIAERENLKLQSHNMPKKYWKYILETYS